MNFIWCSLGIELIDQIRKKRTWFLTLLLPLLVLAAVKLIPAEEKAAPVQVGIVVLDEDRDCEAFVERLFLRSGNVVTFIRADEETAYKKVASAKWDCAIVLPKDFSRRIRELDTRRIFRMVTGSGSVVYPVVREMVSACLAEEIAPYLAGEYLVDAGIVEEEALADIFEKLQSVLPQEERVQIHVQTLEGVDVKEEDLGTESLDRLLMGAVAVLLVLWTMFAAMDLGQWQQTAFAVSISRVKSLTLIRISKILAVLCLEFVSAALALVIAGASLRQIGALIPYLCQLGVMAMVFAGYRAIWQSFPVLMPFVPALVLITLPGLYESTGMYPVQRIISFCIPVNLYLEAAAGQGRAILIQTAITVLLLAFLLITENRFLKGRRTYDNIQ